VVWEEARRRSVAVAHRYARHPDDVEDIAQEAMLRAWRHQDAVRDRDSFFAWLATIVRNEAARITTRRRPVPASLVDEDQGAEDERLSTAPDRMDLHRSLKQLDERERLLLRLRYEDDLTYAAIADRLGVPEGTVKVRLHRARIELHRALSEQ
jgi:RNA polymerase sigma-70 factor (ECF subfamily)